MPARNNSHLHERAHCTNSGGQPPMGQKLHVHWSPKPSNDDSDDVGHRRERTALDCEGNPVPFHLAGGDELRVQNAALSPWRDITGAYDWHEVKK